ncbi:transcriptional regulator [Nocardia goodfellowii]|uniref:Tetratricopeptide (TPR) repeat protein n=1 Tax=Nocardia goodfellowii TaxID=882446 RepID=A0ABS4QLG0_9NOCA|nr:transcriptional regulator [Nocardia goodfellowii]MBP2191501.1 tetratricopeptide (TPR) repeat protein [Nocardia goodfellowii]
MRVQLSWTGLEVRALREALREPRRGFCEITGVNFDSLRKWERQGPEVTLRPANAAIMDTTLERATEAQRARFEQLCRQRRPGHQIATMRRATPKLDIVLAERSTTPNGPSTVEIDMNRRELLRLLSLSGTVLAAPVDWDRITAASSSAGRIDAATATEYANINSMLWREYAAADTKSAIFPALREQLRVLIDGMRRTPEGQIRQHLGTLTGEALQLAGELQFDHADYGTAAYCYTLAADFSRDAAAMDLWACALTRHAYLGIYDRDFSAAIVMLESAAHLARRGDPTLTTRFWIEAVTAQAHAGLGNALECERASDSAQLVTTLPEPQRSNWLRYDGSRIEEELGACYIQLGRPAQAEEALLPLLNQPLSARRRAAVLTDLAAAGALRGDPVQAVEYGNAALDVARRTHSGYLGRRLEQLRRQLEPLHRDRHIQHLDRRIAALSLR